MKRRLWKNETYVLLTSQNALYIELTIIQFLKLLDEVLGMDFPRRDSTSYRELPAETKPV